MAKWKKIPKKFDGATGMYWARDSSSIVYSVQLCRGYEYSPAYAAYYYDEPISLAPEFVEPEEEEPTSEFWQSVRRIAEEVRSWPEWMQNGSSIKPRKGDK